MSCCHWPWTIDSQKKLYTAVIIGNISAIAGLAVVRQRGSSKATTGH
jgi:hypothetical protein